MLIFISWPSCFKKLSMVIPSLTESLHQLVSMAAGSKPLTVEGRQMLQCDDWFGSCVDA